MISEITIQGDYRIFEDKNYVTMRKLDAPKDAYSVHFGIKGHISHKAIQDTKKANEEVKTTKETVSARDFSEPERLFESDF